MSFVTSTAAMARNDLKLVWRDAMLIGVFVYVLLVAVLLRWGIPWLMRFLLAKYGFDLEPYLLLVVSYLVVTFGSLPGILIGFVLLDERDEHTLDALMVTPLPFSQYLGYRIGGPMVFGFLVTVLVGTILDFAGLAFWRLVIIAALASPLGPLSALILGTFADNKVQGFAYMKLLSGWGIIPAAAWFVPEPWQYLAGLVPPYWALKAYWVAVTGEPGWWLYLALGLVANAAMLWWLARRFERVARRG